MATSPILLYDGVCRLCNNAVKFILTRDPGAHFRFCAIQSSAAQPLLQRAGISQEDALTSFVLLGSSASAPVLRRSDAALAIASRLTWPWPLLAAAGALVPRLLRDAVYDCVASRRYQWFGKVGGEEEGSCLSPMPHILRRFVDAEEIKESLKKRK
jgi:predicted DCC family thiol-disulfide oxidoreductase YuxK